MKEQKQIPGECKACHDRIIFLWTTKNKMIPVNPGNVGPDEVIFNWKKHVNHFITCPRAEVLRKPRQEDPDEVKRKMETAFFKSLEKFKEKVKNDTRKFITHNQHEITMARYSLLNVCAEEGMGYDELISKSNSELREWLAETGTLLTKEKFDQLTLI